MICPSTVIRSVAESVREAGGEPFVVPAMGSHGGATASGQEEVLAHYGVMEETVRAPVRASMDTVELGSTASGATVHMDRLASEANVVRGRTGYDREILDVGLERIKATMPVEGSYFDLVRFINHLERSERFFLVEGVRLSQRESDDQAVELECSIAFYLRPSPVAEASGS